MVKIYTKTGDDGTTVLGSGERVTKDQIRIEAYGTVDELNACLGLVLTAILTDEIRICLQNAQVQLFDIGAELACPEGKDYKFHVPRLKPESIVELENEIDALNLKLPPLSHFILPGGSPAASWLHLCRTVCRRAERVIVTLHNTEGGHDLVIQYLNRFSDLLFVMARYQNLQDDIPETQWVPNQ